MKKFKNILFLLVVLLLVVVKVEAADYSVPALPESKYTQAWKKAHATANEEYYLGALVVSDGNLVLGYETAMSGDEQVQTKVPYALIEKYDDNGELVWSKKHDGVWTKYYDAVEVSDGYVVFLQYCDDVTKQSDYALVKYSFAGEKVWETTLEADHDDAKAGFIELSYYNGLVSVVFGDANVYFVNVKGELVKELTMTEASYPMAQMNKNGIYVVRNVLNEQDLSLDLVLEVYDYDYKLVSTKVLYESEFNTTTNEFTKLAIVVDLDIVSDKVVVLMEDAVDYFTTTLILDDKYEVVKELKYSSNYHAYENEVSKDGFVSLIEYYHHDSTCNPQGVRNTLIEENVRVRDARKDYACGVSYMMIYKYNISGEEVWKLDLDIPATSIGSYDRELLVLANLDADIDGFTNAGDFDAYVYKYVGEFDVTTKTDGNGEVAVNRTEGSSEVEFTVTPKEGYKLVKVTVTTADGNTVEFTDNKFTMPTDDVVITAEFEKLPENPNTGLSNPLFIFGGILGIAFVGSIVVKKKKFM